MSKYPHLLEIMLGVEGLISRRSSHASGVILFDEDPYEFGCFMKTPSGDIITQYDLHDDEAAGMTKYDFLVTSIQDKIVQVIKFLQEDGEIDNSLTLREVYDTYLHPEVINIEDKDVWNRVQNVAVLDLFQFDSQVGSQAAKKLKPSNLLELADANGLMRLMTAEKGEETPMDKYHRFKNNINLWYAEMERYGLTSAEMETLKPHFLRSHGVPPSQEQMMTMLMDENICHFSLKDANAARKIVGKKQMDKIPALREQVMSQAKRPELGKYIWECGIGPQMGYSFSIIHALAYSFIGFQTIYIATRWNPIYWNTACLIVNGGSLDSSEGETTDYTKIAKMAPFENFELIKKHIEDMKPDLVIVDSIQAIYTSQVQSTAGSVSQIRECCNSLMTIAKAVISGTVFRAPEERFTTNNVAVSSLVLDIGEKEETLVEESKSKSKKKEYEKAKAPSLKDEYIKLRDVLTEVQKIDDPVDLNVSNEKKKK